MALGVDGMSMTGEVFINDDLLLHDASLVGPLSRNLNVPRWWLLPVLALREGVNTVRVRALGLELLAPGLGSVRLGNVAEVAAEQEQSQWRRRAV